MSAYAKRDYRVVSRQGSALTMLRSATSFEWFWLFGSFFFGFGIGGLVYVALWLLWRVPRPYSVYLDLNDYGQVTEFGDTLAVFDRDRLKLSRIRNWIFGVILALLGIMSAMGFVLTLSEATDPVSNVISFVIFVGACAVGAFLFLRSAVGTTQKLKS